MGPATRSVDILPLLCVFLSPFERRAVGRPRKLDAPLLFAAGQPDSTARFAQKAFRLGDSQLMSLKSLTLIWLWTINARYFRITCASQHHRNLAISNRISWDVCRGTATSAIWNVT